MNLGIKSWVPSARLSAPENTSSYSKDTLSSYLRPWLTLDHFYDSSFSSPSAMIQPSGCRIIIIPGPAKCSETFLWSLISPCLMTSILATMASKCTQDCHLLQKRKRVPGRPMQLQYTSEYSRTGHEHWWMMTSCRASSSTILNLREEMWRTRIIYSNSLPWGL